VAWDLSYGPMGLGFDSFRIRGFLFLIGDV
jgi:hypothetical protein